MTVLDDIVDDLLLGITLAGLLIHCRGEDDGGHFAFGEQRQNFTLRSVGKIETRQRQREIMSAQQGIGRGHAVAVDHLGLRLFRKARLQQHGQSNGIFNQKDFILHAAQAPHGRLHDVSTKLHSFATARHGIENLGNRRGMNL